MIIKRKEKTCHLVDFAFPANHTVKMKESENIDKCLNLARELERNVGHKEDCDANYWKCARDSPKNLERGPEELQIRGRIESCQTIIL